MKTRQQTIIKVNSIILSSLFTLLGDKSLGYGVGNNVGNDAGNDAGNCVGKLDGNPELLCTRVILSPQKPPRLTPTKNLACVNIFSSSTAVHDATLQR